MRTSFSPRWAWAAWAAWACLAACAAGSLGATGGAGATDEQPAKKLRIAVIPKGTTHVFWKSVERGARQAGDELGVEIIWKGPLKENDRAQQIQLVQQFVTQGVDAIVLAPLDHRALVGPVKEARARSIPVVIFDSALEGEPGKDFAAFVATDNEAAGKLAGEFLAGKAHGGGAVVLRYLVGSASTASREKGCLDALRAANVPVLSENQHAGATAGEAKTTALNMVDTLRKAAVIFTPNESSTYGMLLALRQAGLAGKVTIAGFDASPPLIEGLRSGEIAALVVQDPVTMGYKGVQSAVKTIRGEKTDAVVDTGAVLVTKENIDTPKVKKLIE